VVAAKSARDYSATMLTDLLSPPELDGVAVAIILVTSFVGSAMTAAFSIGGGLLLIAVMTSLMPAATVVPVHGFTMFGSNGGRLIILRTGVDVTTFGWFAAGAVVGGALGAPLATALPANVLRVLVAAFILFTQWGPQIRMALGKRTFVAAGAISTFLTLFVGASGPFMTSIISKMPGYSRINVVGTTAACMTLQHGIKVVVFAFAGFAFAPWLPFIAATIAFGFAGTVLGTKLLYRLPEAAFRRLLRWILTGLAGYLLLVVGLGFTG
jgi:uncharacterized membrane protein YfcA